MVIERCAFGRWLAAATVAIAGAVLFPLAGVIPWAWIRECGPLGLVHGAAFFGPGLGAIVALDRRILARRLSASHAALVVLGTVALEWVLGILFFETQWGC